MFCDEFPETTKSLFNQYLTNAIQRIIREPTEEDCTHTNNCLEILEWFYHYNNDTLYKDILRHCDFVELAKQKYNHTEKRLRFMHEVFKYYFSEEPFLDCNRAKSKYYIIQDDIREPFFRISPFFNEVKDKNNLISTQQKYGMELYFILFLYYGVTRLGWNDYRKKKMYDQLYKTDNLPIFAAVGSLWFGHVFNDFQTDDFQAFIRTVAAQYPKVVPWVLKYIIKTEYNAKYGNCDCIKELQSLQISSENRLLAAVLYSAFPKIFEKPILP